MAEISARIDAARSASLVRKPVFDRNLDVVAYELVIGDGPISEITVEGGVDNAARRISVNSVVDIDVTQVGAGKPIQLMVSSPVLESGAAEEFGSEEVMLVLGSGVDSSPSVVSALGGLRDRGIQIALDDFAANRHLHPLLNLATAVKIDVDTATDPSFSKQLAVLKATELDLVADRVDSYDALRAAAKLGFDEFQGTFLSRPDGFRQGAVSAGQLAALELITLLMNSDATISEIADVIRRDVSLSYRIMKVVNSAQYSLPRPLGSIEEAVKLVGTSKIASWVGMMSMSKASDKPSELTRVAMVRARACEALAGHVDRSDVQSFHLVGLFSVIDALLDVPAAQALRDLPVSAEIADAVATHGGVMGEVLRAVVAYEEGNWARASVIGVADEAIGQAFRTAMVETDEVWSRLSGS